MGFVQGTFNFQDIPAPIRVTQSDARKIVAQRAQRYGLLSPRVSIQLENVDLRPEQFVVFEELLSTPSGNILIEIDPGGGKTFLFGGEAVAEANRDEQHRTLFITNGHRLILQCVSMFKRFTTFTPEMLCCVSGENSSPKMRRALYERMPRALAITARALKNDLVNNIFIWDGIRVVYFDEPQKYWRGKDAGAELLRQTLKREALSLRVMSGTLVRSDAEYAVLRYDTRATKTITVASKFEVLGDPLISEKHERPVVVDEDSFPVEPDRELKRLLHALCKAARKCERQIAQMLAMPALFEKPEPEFMRVATDPERQAVQRQILSLSETHPDKPLLLKLWSKWGKLAFLHRLGLLMGRYPIFEYFGYHWAKRTVHPGLYLGEIEDENDRDMRGVLSSADNDIVIDGELIEVVLEATKENPFGVLLRHDNWADILKKTEPMFAPFERKGRRRTDCAERRSKRLQAMNRQLKDGTKKKVVMARYFFHRALSFCAAQELYDHPKVRALINELDKLKEVIQRSRGYVFDWTQRHVELLAETLEARCGRNMGLRPVSLYGGSTAGMAAWKNSAYQGFDGERYNLLVATTAIAGTGIDVADARVAAFYTLERTDPDLWQYLGRVLGRTPDVAYIRVLYTQETTEAGRYARSLAKHYSRRKAVRSRAKVLVPEFIVTKDEIK